MRLAAVSLVLVITAALGAPAAAAPPQHAAKSPEQVAAYWTKERMRAAVPRPVGRAGGPKQQAGKPTKGGDSTSSWTSLAVPLPYSGADRTNGKVFFTLGGSNYVCSGTSVAASAGISLVWTAGHCAHEGPGGYATNFMFAPAWVDGSAPYGKWAATSLLTTGQWASSGDFDYDVAAARVVPAAGAAPSSTLAQIEPPRAMAFNYTVTSSTRFKAYGYPAAGKFNGQRMWMCDSPVTRRDGSYATAPMGIGCDMTGGSSGGGWVDTAGAVGSVNSYGYKGLKNTMFGPYQGSAAETVYSSMR